jgi:two-component system, NarL family, response regulator NreC
MQNGEIAILLADDHGILRQGLRRILESEPDMKVVSEAATGIDAVKRAQEFKPDVVILDVTMPGQSGIESLRQIMEIPNTRIRVLILSVHLEYEVISAAVAAGASGYLAKDTLDSELIAAVRTTMRGGMVLSPSASQVLASALKRGVEPAGQAIERLTRREREVFMLLAEGRSPKEIAQTLFVSPKTIHTHRQSINEKLGVRTTTQLIQFAIREGFIKMA